MKRIILHFVICLAPKRRETDFLDPDSINKRSKSEEKIESDQLDTSISSVSEHILTNRGQSVSITNPDLLNTNGKETCLHELSSNSFRTLNEEPRNELLDYMIRILDNDIDSSFRQVEADQDNNIQSYLNVEQEDLFSYISTKDLTLPSNNIDFMASKPNKNDFLNSKNYISIIPFVNEDIYNFDPEKISYVPNKEILENAVGVYFYLKNYISNVLPSTAKNILKQYENENKKINSSISKLIVKKSSKKSPPNNFQTFAFKLTLALEERFTIRMMNLYRVLAYDQRHALNPDFDFLFKNVKFCEFYQKFISSSLVHSYFKKENLTQNIEEPTKKTIFLFKGFNEFYMKYAQSLIQFYNYNFGHYYKKFNPIFGVSDPQLQKDYFQVWVFDLFNNKTNSLLIVLFPELRVILDRIPLLFNFVIHYKRLHFFFSLLVLKLNFHLPKIKSEFDKLGEDLLITDSEFMNLFCLEIRCFICILSLFIFTEEDTIKIMFLKAFACYMRSLDSNILKYFLFDEYTILENKKDALKQTQIDFNSKNNFYLINKVATSGIPKCDILSISPNFVKLENPGLIIQNEWINSIKKDSRKGSRVYEVESESLFIVKQVTEIFREYLTTFN
ncbi:hypothetical protein TUBRATIS_13380 [Tubulinosema ratisbonensis]|uniref:Uncharacterized protein n=1 Tax=Tubulinosema ratisbonensis TaxID=291195 RepID=A0A437AMB7_9MICR|nr:hypothetical protein TUBRATIS_13380 [Tubulinosema ratisbonensis]